MSNSFYLPYAKIRPSVPCMGFTKQKLRKFRGPIRPDFLTGFKPEGLNEGRRHFLIFCGAKIF
jgi:hypothetical protein